MDYRLELVPIPVSDVDRAKAFYAERVGFEVDLDVSADTDHRVSDERRVVQLTPPGSACSIAFGIGILDTQPGSVQGLHLVVSDIEAARGARRAQGGGRRGRGPRRRPVRPFQRSGRERLDLAAAALLAYSPNYR